MFPDSEEPKTVGFVHNLRFLLVKFGMLSLGMSVTEFSVIIYDGMSLA